MTGIASRQQHTAAPDSAEVIAEGVRAGRESAVSVTRRSLARIESLDPRFRAFAHVRAEAALAEAAAVDARADKGSLPLAGVPVAVKDNIAVAGAPSRAGSRATPATLAGHDDELVLRLRRAGAVIVGLTRMPELAIWPFTEFEADEPVTNPWAAELTCGGSSGGAAVAVATGMAALAVGSDGGGSLRVPAACCGIVGLKPSPAIVPQPGGGAHWRGLTEWGPLARTVGDVALLLDVLAGEQRYRDASAGGSPMRIAVSAKPAMPGARMHPESRQAARAAAASLQAGGHQVTSADPPYPADLGLRFGRRWLPGIADDARAADTALLEDRSRRMARAGRVLDKLHMAANAPDPKLAARMRQWFSDYDILLTPVLADPHVRTGRWHGKGWITTMLGVGNWVMTTPWNLAGFPAISVPAGIGSLGSPIGIQLVAARGGDAQLLAAARAVETAMPWSRWNE